MYSIPPTPRDFVESNNNGIPPLSARSAMSNAADDVSTLHYYRAQQRQQKKDSLLQNTVSVQRETVRGLTELKTRLRHQHTLGMLAAHVSQQEQDPSTFVSDYFSREFLSRPNLQTLCQAVAGGAYPREAGGGTAASVFSSQFAEPIPSSSAGEAHTKTETPDAIFPVDFLRVEQYVKAKEASLKASQQTFGTSMQKINEAWLQLQQLNAEMGDTTSSPLVAPNKRSPTSISKPHETISDMPMFSQNHNASTDGEVGGRRQGPNAPAPCSKLHLAQERVRHLTERLAYLKQQTPPADEVAQLFAKNGEQKELVAGGGASIGGGDGVTSLLSSMPNAAAAAGCSNSPLAPPLLLASVETAIGGNPSVSSSPAAVAAASGSTPHDAIAAAENENPLCPPAAAQRPMVVSPMSLQTPTTEVDGTMMSSSPLELQHKRRVDAERTKLSLLAHRRGKLEAVQHLMKEEGRARSAVEAEWRSSNVMEAFIAEVVAAMDPSLVAQITSALAAQRAAAVGSENTSGASQLCVNVPSHRSGEQPQQQHKSSSPSMMHSPRDVPMVPAANIVTGAPLPPTPRDEVVPNRASPNTIPSPSAPPPSFSFSPLAIFLAYQSMQAEGEVRRLQELYHARVKAYDVLEERAALIQQHQSANGAAGKESKTSHSSVDELKALIKAQEEQISALQDEIVALEHDLSPEGDFVDLDAMLLELRPQGPDTAPPMVHEQSSTLGKMAAWASCYGNHLIDCAKEMAMVEAESIKLAQLIANLEVERSDFVIKAQYKGAHSLEQQQLDALDQFRELESALASAEKEASTLRANIASLEAQAANRQHETDSIDQQRRVYFGMEAALEGEKRDLQREFDQITFVLESVKRALESVSLNSHNEH